MNRTMAPVPASTTLAVAALAALAVGCVSDISPLTVEKFTLLETGKDGLTCIAGGTELSETLLDTSGTDGLWAGALVRNALADNSSELRVNGNTAALSGAKVSYRSTSGLTLPDDTFGINAAVEPGGSRSLVVPLLSADSVAALAGEDGGQLIVTLTLTGRLRDGSPIESVPTELPVQLCYGCLKALCGPEQEFAPGCFNSQPDAAHCVDKEAGAP